MNQPVALYLQDAHSIREGIDFVTYAESKGFDAVWQAESRLVREATVPMAAFATSTSTIKIGSGVVDCWSRNPARLAATVTRTNNPDHPAPCLSTCRRRNPIQSHAALINAPKR